MMEGSILQKSVMKGLMKGKILKKLKSIKQVGYLKPDRILQVRAAEGLVDSIHKISNFVAKKTEQGLRLRLENQSGCENDDDVNENVNVQAGDVIEDDADGMEVEDKENVVPLAGTDVKDSILEAPVSEINVSCFRRPDVNSGSLFDPKLLEAFEEARRMQRLISVKAEERLLTESVVVEEDEEERPLKVQKTEQEDPLTEFELKCPPGGSNAVVLYTTTLRGIRKTFEDCQSIKFLLQTLKVQFFERDVSMHAEYRAEMCGVLEDDTVVPPRLFVKGRYVGGADEVLRLHEEGRFKGLLEGIGVDEGNWVCDGCGGMRFVLCFRCSGSRRVAECGGGWAECGECNENGLIVCPYCC